MEKFFIALVFLIGGFLIGWSIPILNELVNLMLAWIKLQESKIAVDIEKLNQDLENYESPSKPSNNIIGFNIESEDYQEEEDE